MDSEQAAARVRQAGLRVTAPRLAVLAALAENAHLTVETIARGARERLGSLSVQAVYDNLEVLAAAGIVRRIEPAGSPARFELRVGDNHHHLVCRACGVIRDVDCAVGSRPCLTPSDGHGFVVGEAEVTFWGVCPACQATAGTPAPAAPAAPAAPGAPGAPGATAVAAEVADGPSSAEPPMGNEFPAEPQRPHPTV